jgi:hypothetical protein
MSGPKRTAQDTLGVLPPCSYLPITLKAVRDERDALSPVADATFTPVKCENSSTEPFPCCCASESR